MRNPVAALDPVPRFVGFLSTLFLAAAALLILGPQPPGAPPPVEDYVYRVRITHCRITTPQVATAFRISEDLLVSVAHPFTDIERFHLDGPDGDLSADVVAYVPEKDLAILRLRESIDAPAGRLRSEEIPKQQPVQLATFNGKGELSVDDAFALRRAWVTIAGEGRRRSIELEGDIVAGDSGAPVIYEGELVGTIFATTRGRNRGWAVSLPEITAVLDTVTGDARPLALGCGNDEP